MSLSTHFISRTNAFSPLRSAAPHRLIALRNATFTAAPSGRFTIPSVHGVRPVYPTLRCYSLVTVRPTRRISTDGHLHHRRQERVQPPARPKGWPTRIVTQEDINRFFPGLYATGWSVLYRTQGCADDSSGSSGPHMVPSLKIRLMIQSQDMLLDLKELVEGLERKEKHHVEFIWPTSSLEDLPISLNSEELYSKGDIQTPLLLSMYLHTHSAIRPHTKESVDEYQDSRRCSGITLRDVRFAMLFDEAWKSASLSIQTRVEDREANFGIRKADMHQPMDLSALFSDIKDVEKQ